MKSIRDTLLDIGAGLVVISTITIAGLAVAQHLSARPSRPSARDRAPVEITDWKAVASVGHRVGPENADITVVVFADFECPGCASFATTTYPAFEARYPGRVALVYRHWPLEQHRFAYPAARAAECAALQGRFKQVHDLLYSQQRELGLKAFREFASEAGVPDLEAFDVCYSDKSAIDAIDRDIEEAVRLKGTGTPTVLVNNQMFREGVDLARLDSVARKLLSPQAKAGSPTSLRQ